MTIHMSPTAAAYPSSQLRMQPRANVSERSENKSTKLSNGFRIGMLPSSRIHS